MSRGISLSLSRYLESDLFFPFDIGSCFFILLFLSLCAFPWIVLFVVSLSLSLFRGAQHQEDPLPPLPVPPVPPPMPAPWRSKSPPVELAGRELNQRPGLRGARNLRRLSEELGGGSGDPRKRGPVASWKRRFFPSFSFQIKHGKRNTGFCFFLVDWFPVGSPTKRECSIFRPAGRGAKHTSGMNRPKTKPSGFFAGHVEPVLRSQRRSTGLVVIGLRGVWKP